MCTSYINTGIDSHYSTIIFFNSMNSVVRFYKNKYNVFLVSIFTKFISHFLHSLKSICFLDTAY